MTNAPTVSKSNVHSWVQNSNTTGWIYHKRREDLTHFRKDDLFMQACAKLDPSIYKDAARAKKSFIIEMQREYAGDDKRLGKINKFAKSKRHFDQAELRRFAFKVETGRKLTSADEKTFKSCLTEYKNLPPEVQDSNNWKNGARKVARAKDARECAKLREMSEMTLAAKITSRLELRNTSRVEKI
jgi:hypothetical protein